MKKKVCWSRGTEIDKVNGDPRMSLPAADISQTRAIIQACPTCQHVPRATPVEGCNPRGLAPNDIYRRWTNRVGALKVHATMEQETGRTQGGQPWARSLRYEP
ncbi:hypothetical protein CR201_G0046643 [Pongo abelii]|uniref:Uncharacterized protein n=1 Tax=Pongo abelii TaxID=9601 RepID=A0A2J8S317_PONAB|nr:hypothetical protein CR201_G0046643 [Pongo abelii]